MRTKLLQFENFKFTLRQMKIKMNYRLIIYTFKPNLEFGSKLFNLINLGFNCKQTEHSRKFHTNKLAQTSSKSCVNPWICRDYLQIRWSTIRYLLQKFLFLSHSGHWIWLLFSVTFNYLFNRKLMVPLAIEFLIVAFHNFFSLSK